MGLRRSYRTGGHALRYSERRGVTGTSCPSYYANPYLYSGGAYDLGYYGSDAYVAPSYPDSYSAAAPPPTTTQSYYQSPDDLVGAGAQVTVKVPADAKIWVDGTATTSTG